MSKSTRRRVKFQFDERNLVSVEELEKRGIKIQKIPGTSISYAEGSLVTTFPEQEGEKVLMGSIADSGPRCIGSLCSYDLDTSSWKIRQASLSGEWTLFSQTWPRAGMMRSGTASQLVPLVPPISEIGSIYWPTPVSDDTGHRKKPYSQGGRSLSYMLGGPVNPEWEEWLMGFPPGWTDVES